MGLSWLETGRSTYPDSGSGEWLGLGDLIQADAEGGSAIIGSLCEETLLLTTTNWSKLVTAFVRHL